MQQLSVDLWDWLLVGVVTMIIHIEMINTLVSCAHTLHII